GGSCFPKDVKALIRTAREYGYDMRLLQAVEDVNEDQKTYVVPRLLNYFNNNISDKTFTLWGLSFKPKTDDMREAPALEIIQSLLNHGATVNAHDPVALHEAQRLKLDEKINLFEDSYKALENSDGLILVTEWLEYREPDFSRIKSIMRTPVVFDGRNIYKPEKIRDKGFDYFAVGRP
ncbi:MAG: UDP-glucose/GDP-mannose dehydrogenase family protein, partial [Calditrichia bacterium]|nr:UDP-glucose/GDP-mannose dehydrogenase family protein [Calditrichia bacterium]